MIISVVPQSWLVKNDSEELDASVFMEEDMETANSSK
jgi:hypothetical protein